MQALNRYAERQEVSIATSPSGTDVDVLCHNPLQGILARALCICKLEDNFAGTVRRARQHLQEMHAMMADHLAPLPLLAWKDCSGTQRQQAQADVKIYVIVGMASCGA